MSLFPFRERLLFLSRTKITKIRIILIERDSVRTDFTSVMVQNGFRAGNF